MLCLRTYANRRDYIIHYIDTEILSFATSKTLTLDGNKLDIKNSSPETAVTLKEILEDLKGLFTMQATYVGTVGTPPMNTSGTLTFTSVNEVNLMELQRKIDQLLE